MSTDILDFGKCLDDGCERPVSALGPRCHLHELVNFAKWLSTEDLDELRQAIASVVPLTKRQRSAEQRRMRLEWLVQDASRFEQSVAETRRTGATQRQIDKAIAAGAAKAALS